MLSKAENSAEIGRLVPCHQRYIQLHLENDSVKLAVSKCTIFFMYIQAIHRQFSPPGDQLESLSIT
jgi:hypothetical protein